VHYVGNWEHASASFSLDDAMPLEGWHVFRLGPAPSRNGVATLIDYAASELAKSSKTLGELRKGLPQPAKPDQ
jgi:hypothetical protein